MTQESVKIAVVGATGAVGRRMLQELEHFAVPGEIGLFASARSAGHQIKFRGQDCRVEEFSLERLKGYKYILMSAGGAFSREFSPQLASQGSVIIDNSSAWRMDPQTPLVVPEVNGSVLQGFSQGIIANPNCSTIQLVVSLKPLVDKFGLERVEVVTYQSVSGSGQKGIEELQRQHLQASQSEQVTPTLYARPIFNNLIPAIDVIDDQGHCFEEVKMIRETRKILHLNALEMNATTVRVPVFHCHSEAVTVTLKQAVQRKEVIHSFNDAPGIVLSGADAYDGFVYPQEIVNKREVFVSRVRLPLDQTRSPVVQYWNVADNLLKGAATNAVQILKLLL